MDAVGEFRAGDDPKALDLILGSSQNINGFKGMLIIAVVIPSFGK
jgi:hypothetical protein